MFFIALNVNDTYAAFPGKKKQETTIEKTSTTKTEQVSVS